MQAPSIKSAVNLHASLIKVAKEEVARNIVDEDGEKCFCYFSYLQSLEARLDTIMADRDFPVGDFHLDQHAIARYLWACVALGEGERVYDTTFRGMPTLD